MSHARPRVEPEATVSFLRGSSKPPESAAARKFLLGCGDRFNGQAAYCFELDCLRRQTDDLGRTADCTRRAVDLDRSYQMRMLDHPDLELLRTSWCGEK